MLKTRIATALAAVGVTALSLTVLPGAAQASESTSPSTRAVAAADGNLHVWEHQKRGGRHCAWPNNANWSTCNMRNQGSSVENSGFTHDVWLYYSPDQTGAHFCLNKGVYLENIVHHYFPHNGAGGGKTLNDNIASHKWVADC